MKISRLALLVALLMSAFLSTAVAQIVIYQAGQLDQLLAPIALYPDPLMGQVLAAASYPQQILDAEEWFDDPSHAGWSNDQLLADLQQAPWDASVKALTAFPQVLHELSQNIAWTQNVGNAYAMQQDNVMNVIQDLRRDAQEAGNLYSTPMETVYDQGSDIIIQPRDPNKIAVPVYDPTTVYGAWLYPEYPPTYFARTNAVVVTQTTYVPVVPVSTVLPFFVVHQWDWHRHQVDEIKEEHFVSSPHEKTQPTVTPPVSQQNSPQPHQEIERRDLQPTMGARPLGGAIQQIPEQQHMAPMSGNAPFTPGIKADTNQETQGH
jgi:Protein of unknown function (DUF3300)